MKIIVLSGGCGVGKRSIGEILSEKIGFSLIHNHLTTNIVRCVYGEYSSFNSTKYYSLLCALRKEIICSAHENKLPGLIMTHANHTIVGSEYFIWLNTLCTQLGVDIQFINLICDESVRLQRFLSKERGVFGKSFDLKTFQKIKVEWGDPAFVPEELPVIGVLDTTDKKPHESAECIIKIL